MQWFITTLIITLYPYISSKLKLSLKQNKKADRLTLSAFLQIQLNYKRGFISNKNPRF